MKILFFVFALIVMAVLLLNCKNKNIEAAPVTFIKIESINESKKHLPLLPENFILEIDKKYSDKKHELYTNSYTEISEKLCNDVYNKSRYWEKNQTHIDFLNELTSEQRIYFTLISFEAQVNNGGVYQFLFNCPELSIIALEAMQKTGMKKLSTDYEIVLKEYFGKFDNIKELRSKFNDSNNDWDERWNSFSNGYEEIKSAEIIEGYFYNEEFVGNFQKQMNDFVKENKDGLYKISK
jgi:Domain of unknown function (DUF4375)